MNRTWGTLNPDDVRHAVGTLASAFNRGEPSNDTMRLWFHRLEANGVRLEHLRRAVDRIVDGDERFPPLARVLSVCGAMRRERDDRLRADSRRLLGILQRHAPELYERIVAEVYDDVLAQDAAKSLGLAQEVRAVLRDAGIGYESKGEVTSYGEVIQ